MNYKNLLALHSVQDRIDSLEPMVSLARQFDAHLEVLVLNLASPIPTMTFIQDPYYDWSNNFSGVIEENNQRVKDIKDWLEGQDVGFEVNSVCQQLGLVDDEIAAPALYADLVLFSRGVESLVSGMMAKALKGAVFDAAKPALILGGPAALKEMPFPTIAIAWDGSSSVMRAISSSIPFLRVAEKIELTIVTREEDQLIHEARTKKVRQWLKRSGVSVELSIVRQENKPVSAIILDYVNGIDHDLIVMGAYGHTRFAEKLFSGVTHQVLDKATTSLLIAH